MKKLLVILFIIGAIGLTVSFQDDNKDIHAVLRSGGVNSVISEDRTGSPISNGTCSSCHSGSSLSSSVEVSLLDNGNAITEYTPGETYTLQVKVNGNGTGFGFQSSVLANNTNAGSMSSAISANTQVSGNNGIYYAEHDGTASANGSYNFQVNWTAPTAGTGNVTIYASGLTVNKNSNTSGDGASNTSLIIAEGGTSAINHNSQSTLKLFPNPLDNSNIIYFSGMTNNVKSVELFDINGKRLKTLDTITNKTQIDVSDYTNNQVFILKVTFVEDEVAVYKVVR